MGCKTWRWTGIFALGAVQITSYCLLPGTVAADPYFQNLASARNKKPPTEITYESASGADKQKLTVQWTSKKRLVFSIGRRGRCERLVSGAAVALPSDFATESAAGSDGQAFDVDEFSYKAGKCEVRLRIALNRDRAVLWEYGCSADCALIEDVMIRIPGSDAAQHKPVK